MPLTVPTLTDDVVALRRPAERDLDAITAACQDPEIPRFTRIRSPYTRADAEEFLRASVEHWADGSSASFVVADRSTDRLMGAMGVMRLTEARDTAEIGYWVAPADRRRGVASRALRLVSRWAVLDLGVRRLELMTRVENVASQAVAERAGFAREGLLRSYMTHSCGLTDVFMFSLLPADLEPTIV
jgi:RimJ/RimL family protein N-acetyltransferase